MLWHVPAHAATQRVALVIEHGASWSGPRVIWKCVEFAQDALSGLALLEVAGVNSGQPPQVFDWGGGAYTVCQVDREPVTVPEKCFGPTSGPNWSDWSMAGGAWHLRSAGAGGYTVRDGDLEGWTYTAGFGVPPPAVHFSQVCPPLPAVAAPTGRAVPATTAVQPTAAPPAAATASTPPATLQASAPPIRSSGQTALARTGPTSAAPRTSSSIGTWLLLGVGSAFLLALGALNLLRRGP